MYNSLTFYYSNFPLKDTTTNQPLPLNVVGQLQTIHEWLKIEHSQHQQWTSSLMQDYETSHCYDMQTFVGHKQPTSVDPFLVRFTPILWMSSKLVYSQLTMCHTRAMFPALSLNVSGSLSTQPIDWPKFTTLYSESFAQDREVLQQLLSRFIAWFTFSKLYFSFYVRKVNLEEDGRLSDTFSNRLVCHWLRGRCFASYIQGSYSPYMAPTHTEVHNHLKNVKDRLNRMKTVPQSALIFELNSCIHTWISAWDLSIRWSTLTYCEDRLRRLLQRWAKRRHPNKGWGWVCHKYWRVGPTASKCIFWLWLLSTVYASSKPRLTLKAQLVNLVQTRLADTVSEVSSFTNCQFFCMESRAGLLPYTVRSFKKWRKSRSLEHFLLY
jgi:hypothetical protein